MTSETQREDLPALTGLRFVAAALIVMVHMRGKLGVPADFPFNLALENGVSFFFVLSGFILTHVHRTIETAEERRAFYRNRFARIWPLHVACILLVYLIIGSPSRLGTADNLPTDLLNLALLQSWVPDYVVFLSYNSVSWSLSVEAFFYALFPLLIVRFRQRAAFWLSLCVGVVVTMIIATQMLSIGPMVPGQSSVSIPGMLYANPAVRLIEFVAGVATAYLWSARRAWLDNSEAQSTALQVLAVALLVGAYFAIPYVSRYANHTIGLLPLAAWMRSSGTTFLPAAFLIFAFASRRGALRHVMASRLAVYLGQISFAVYLFHQIPINAHDLNPDRFAAYQNAIGCFVMLSVIMLGAIALHHFVENPARRAIISRFSQ